MKTKKLGLELLALMCIGFAPVGRDLLLAQTPYALPNNNTGCPGNCRVIKWSAGTYTIRRIRPR